MSNQLYSYVAKALTMFENHKTETDHQRSRIFKVFLFQFINSYFCLYYAAFYKKFHLTIMGQGPVPQSARRVMADTADPLRASGSVL